MATGAAKSPNSMRSTTNTKDDGRGENEEKVAEGTLLFLIEASVHYADGRGHMQRRYFGADQLHSRSQTGAFESAFYYDVALKVFAADFDLSGIAFEGG